MESGDQAEFVSRGGRKLSAALDAFRLQPAGWVCLDIGSHVGGFVDCLLQRGALRVHAVEPGRGVLDERLRADERVIVHEGANALRFVAPERCALVTIDAGWTPQRLILPAARRATTTGGQIVTLVKPQYEAPREWLHGGVLPAARHQEVLALVRDDIRDLGVSIVAETISPLRGHAGNTEWFFQLTLD
jgi:23S rRNA (cytidine1920-2'-O)/16S rRNA (cytidine1409-2'-O)-methyltransferase